MLQHVANTNPKHYKFGTYLYEPMNLHNLRKMEKKPYFAVLLRHSIYAGMFLLSKAAFDGGMNNFIFVFYRQAIATLFLLPIALYFEWYFFFTLQFCFSFFIFLASHFDFDFLFVSQENCASPLICNLRQDLYAFFIWVCFYFSILSLFHFR